MAADAVFGAAAASRAGPDWSRVNHRAGVSRVTWRSGQSGTALAVGGPLEWFQSWERMRPGWSRRSRRAPFPPELVTARFPAGRAAIGAVALAATPPGRTSPSTVCPQQAVMTPTPPPANAPRLTRPLKQITARTHTARARDGAIDGPPGYPTLHNPQKKGFSHETPQGNRGLSRWPTSEPHAAPAKGGGHGNGGRPRRRTTYHLQPRKASSDRNFSHVQRVGHLCGGV